MGQPISDNGSSAELCERLWGEYEQPLRKICQHKLSGSPYETDDVIGDTFLALCDAANRHRRIDNYEAWLKGTLNNIIKRKYSEMDSNRKKLVHIESIEQELYYFMDFDENKLSEQSIDSIKKEIYSQLRPNEQSLLLLSSCKHLRQAEIAQAMHISEAAVRQRYYRLRCKVTDLVADKVRCFN